MSADKASQKKPITKDKRKIAFCLGGLGGFNAHTVGFLQAARDIGLKPSIITCTSGGIHWTWRYLVGADMKQEIHTQAKEANRIPSPLDWMNTLVIAMTGDPGVFRPATMEYMARWFQPWKAFSPMEMLNRMFPAQVYVPLRPKERFGAIADTFNASDIPIVFNTYNIQTGVEFLHANVAALAFLKARYGDHDRMTEYAPIDHDAVAAAFWLYLYGFTPGASGHVVIDGAYRRQIIMRELLHCDLLFVVKPQNHRWVGAIPQNMFDVEDFKTEMWFNGSLAGEIAVIEAYNKLLADGKLKDGAHTHTDIVLVEVPHQLGFFHYFTENTDVYHSSYAKSRKLLTDPLFLALLAKGADDFVLEAAAE